MGTTKTKCIFIHGNSSTETIWKPFQEELAKILNFQPHNVSYPSVGSNKSDQWSKSNLVEDILKNIPEDFKNNAIIFGHSLGGHLAIELASKLPSTKGLVLLQCSPSKSIEMLSGFFEQNSLAAACMFKQTWSKNEFRYVCKELSDPHKPSEEFINSIKINNEKLRKDLGASLANEGLENEWVLLSKIKSDKILILFDSDPILKIHDIKNDLVRLDSLQVVLSKAKGHYGLYYEPELLNQELRSFIQKIKLKKY